MKRRKVHKDMPKWEVPDNLQSKNLALRIDQTIAELYEGGGVPICERLRDNRDAAMYIARRGLEVAILKAGMVRQQSLGPIIEDWSSIAKAADRAQAALSFTIKNLAGGKAKGPPDIFRALQTSKAFRADNLEDMFAQVDKAANILFEAERVLGLLSASADVQSKKLKASHKNEGEADTRAFAETLGETWFALTERRPARTQRQGENPFMRFLIAAWRDAGGAIDDSQGDASTVFVRSVDAAHRALPPERTAQMIKCEQTLPDWL